MRILVAAIGKLKRGAESDLSERYRERAAKSGRGIGLRSLDIVEIAESRAREAQRRMLEGFARFDHAARQRHLTAVPLEGAGANGQDDMRLGPARKEEQQAGRQSNARGIEVRTPL